MINKRQYIILSFFMTRCIFIGGGFSLLIGLGKNNVLLTCFLGMLLGICLLYLFYKKGKINNLFIILISLGVLIINTTSNGMLTSTYLLTNTPIFLLLLLTIVVLLYGSKKGLSAIAKTSEIIIIFVTIVYILCYGGLTPYAKINNLAPLFNSNFMDSLKSMIVFCSASLAPNLLLINYKNDLKFKDVSIGYIVSCLSILILMFFILSIYGCDFTMKVRFPEYLILKRINILDYINNIENILVMEWLVNILISSLICVTLISMRTSKKVFYLGTVVFIFITDFFINRNYANVIIIKQYCFYILLFLILMSLLWKKERN